MRDIYGSVEPIIQFNILLSPQTVLIVSHVQHKLPYWTKPSRFNSPKASQMSQTNCLKADLSWPSALLLKDATKCILPTHGRKGIINSKDDNHVMENISINYGCKYFFVLYFLVF